MRQQIAVGAYNRHTKKLGSKDWGVRCFENMGFEKLPQFLGTQKTMCMPQVEYRLRKT